MLAGTPERYISLTAVSAYWDIYFFCGVLLSGTADTNIETRSSNAALTTTLYIFIIDKSGNLPADKITLFRTHLRHWRHKFQGKSHDIPPDISSHPCIWTNNGQ